MKSIVTFLGILFVTQTVFAANTIRCFNRYEPNVHAPVFTAVNSGPKTLSNLVWYDAELGTKNEKQKDQTFVGKLNPLSRKYKDWLYFGVTNIILEPDFATAEAFKGSIVISNNERDGGTTFLHCLNTKIEPTR